MASKAPVSRSVVVESVSSAVNDVYEKILLELEANGFGEEDIFAIHLALEEGFLNAVKHGNKRDAGKEVRIDYSVGQDKVEISMTDEGDGFDWNGIPDPRVGKNLYRANGRGIFLMRSYMDVVEFNERGNRVHMIRYRERPRLTGG
jgi:serine/threonine-protein kinase RsbW